jgi:hypothetical protein
MIRDFLIMILNLLIVEPFQSEIQSRLAAAKAPEAIIQQVTECAANGPGALADSISSNWVAGLTTVTYVVIGVTSPEAALSSIAPSCAKAITSARPFLEADAT